MENEKPKPENALPNEQLIERRSLSAVAITAGEIVATGGLLKAGALAVDAAAEKIKDVLPSKDEEPKK
jgi:hypothetical protein